MSNARRDDAPTSPRSDRVRSIRALDRRALRYERMECRVEGPQAVREALKSKESILHLYATEDFAETDPDLSLDAVIVSDDVLQAMTDVTTPQGVIAVARIDAPSLHVLTHPRLVLVAHEVRDPGNLGTMIRTADAAGADAVVITGDSVDPWSPKVIRSAAGSHWHLPVINNVTLSEVKAALGATPLVATKADAPRYFFERDLTQPVAWLLGNEAHGLSPEANVLADEAAALPIYGSAESLNVAITAGILLYASAAAQRTALH